MRKSFLITIVCLAIPTISAQAQTAQLDSLKRVLSIATEDTIRIRALYDISYAMMGHNIDSSLTFAKQCLQIAERQSIPKFRCSAALAMATSYMYLEHSDSARRYFEKALVIASDPTLKKQRSALYTNYGIFYKRQQKYDLALQQYLKGLAIDEEAGMLYGVIVKCLNIGNLYMELSEFDKAYASNRKALKLIPQLNHKNQQAIHGLLLNNIGTIFAHKTQLDSALIYFKASLVINEQIENQIEISRNNQNIGSMLEKMDRPAESLPYLRRALILRKQINDGFGLVETHMQLGSSFGKLKNMNLADLHFDSAMHLAIKFDNLGLQGEVNLAKSNTYEQIGAFKEALAAHRTHLLLKDSLRMKYDSDAMADMEAKYEASKKDLTIAQQELILSRRTSQRNLLLTGLGGVFILGWFLMYRYQKNRKLQSEKIANLEKYQQILMMDSMLQGQEEERKRIARDLHDGLGALLAAARMQMQNIQREIDKLGDLHLFGKTERLIDNACKEVRRISHDMMPSALSDLGFIAAIEDMIDDVRSHKNLQFNLKFPQHKIDLDNAPAINLYRVIQEILQNVVKHAEATVVDMSIIENEQDLHFSISDDGRGFDKDAKMGMGIGLNNIISRIKYLQGNIRIETFPGEGCNYHIVIPLQGTHSQEQKIS